MPILSAVITRGLSVNNFRKKIYGNVAVQYLVVAGGGGSGYYFSGIGGGGGAGGLRTGTQNTIEAARLLIVVGAGGLDANGSNSSVISIDGSRVWSNVISDGGGQGGRNKGFYGGSSIAGQSGGSGGGGGAEQGSGGGNAGLGYTPQGNNGGGGYGNAAGRGSGGGGGAGGAGTNGFTVPGVWTGGDAGAALASSITGTPVNYAGGGQGVGTNVNGASATPGGLGNQSASANGGGGAGGNSTAGSDFAGGSGIVILRCIARASNIVGGATETQVGNDWIYSFTGSGEIVLGAI